MMLPPTHANAFATNQANTTHIYIWTTDKGTQTQAPLLFFQGLITPTTMIATIINRMMMAMHIHFREFFWSFLALWSAVVPLWTWSTALLTWTSLLLTQIELNVRCVLHTNIYIQKNQGCENTNIPGFQCCLKFLLEHQLKLPCQGKSEK